jgi:hypothetical protein
MAVKARKTRIPSIRKETNKRFLTSAWINISPRCHQENRPEGMANPVREDIAAQSASFVNIRDEKKSISRIKRDMATQSSMQ